MALSHVGSDAQVSSIDPVDGSVESGHCARFFRLARTELLESFSWSWAKTRVKLSAVANPSVVWAYAYGKPANMLNASRILQTQYLTDFGFSRLYGAVTADEMRVWSEYGTADYDSEGEVILTNEPNATLLYTIDVIDTSKWSPRFNTSFSYLLASLLAGPLIKGSEGAKTSGQFRQIAMKLAGSAAATDASSSAEPGFTLASSIRARA